MKNLLIFFLMIAGNITLPAQEPIKETRKFTQLSGAYLGQKLPGVAAFAADPRYKYIEPAFGNDGKRFFFASNMPKDGKETTELSISREIAGAD